MKTMLVFLLSVLTVLFANTPASAQLVAAKDAPVAMGHIHLYVPNIDAHKKFWIDTLGGTPVKFATSATDYVRFHNLIILLTRRESPGGSKGSVVDHVGFQVPSVRAIVDKLKAAGYPIVTRAELPGNVPVKDEIGFIQDQNANVAMTMAPDDVKVEFVENKRLAQPISMHHIHFAAPNVEEMRSWYVKTFAAKPGKRGSVEVGELGGVTLMFSPASGSVAPLKGRVLDHIGFEIKDLVNFDKVVELRGGKLARPGRKNENLPLTVGWATDPWGTEIELTEGFAAESQFRPGP